MDGTSTAANVAAAAVGNPRTGELYAQTTRNCPL